MLYPLPLHATSTIPSSSRLFPTLPTHSPTPASHMLQYELHPVLTEYVDILQCFCSLGNSELFNQLRLHEEIHIHTTHRCGAYRAVVYCKLHLTYVMAIIPAQIYDCKIFFHACRCTIFCRRHVIVFECKILPNLAAQDFINHSMTQFCADTEDLRTNVSGRI